jgi:hypothetical protein
MWVERGGGGASNEGHIDRELNSLAANHCNMARDSSLSLMKYAVVTIHRAVVSSLPADRASYTRCALSGHIPEHKRIQ